MADGSSNLEIIISAVDEASAAFDEINTSLEGVAESANMMVDSTTASFNEFMASVEEAATTAGVSEYEILQQMEATGLGAQQVADEIVAANEEVEASNDVSKGSFTSIGIAAGIAFYAIESAVSNAVSSAQSWNVESAIIQKELQNTGSSIPLSQVQAYATEVMNTTILTQQQALQSEGLILKYKDLQGSYQSLTMLGADLATAMSQISGTMTDNMPKATELLTNALENPVAGINALIRQAGSALPAATVTALENLAKVGDTAAAKAQLIDILTNSVGGLAIAAGKADPLTQLNNQLTALGTTIANSGLINDLNSFAQAIIPIVQNIHQWVTEHPKLTEAIVLGTLAFTAFLAVASIIGIVLAAGASAVVGAALLIATTIAASIAIIAPNWKAFWTGLQIVTTDATEAIAAIVYNVLNLILAGIYLFSNTINGTFKLMWDVVSFLFTSQLSLIKENFQTSLTDVKAIWTTAWNDISAFVQTIWTTIENTVKTGVDNIISVINGFINALDSIHISLPSIKIPGTSLATPAINLGFTIPDIPMLAAGGFVTQPTLALIGESGPEAVIPLSSGYGGAGGQQQQIVININGGIFPADGSTMKQIGDLLAKSILRGLRPVSNYAP